MARRVRFCMFCGSPLGTRYRVLGCGRVVSLFCKSCGVEYGFGLEILDSCGPEVGGG